jgi:hypothetical protein
MTPFDWGAGLKFALVYASLIIIPCCVIGVMGKRLIDNLGRHPSDAPVIQMSALWWLVLLETGTFACLLIFYRFFAGSFQ